MKIKLLLMSFVSLFSQTVLPSDVTDSLVQKLNNYQVKDTIRAEIYQDLIWEYLWVNPKKSIELSDELIQMSSEIDYQIGVAVGNSCKGTAYYYLSKYDSSLLFHNFSLEISNKINDQIGVATSYNNIGMVYTAQSKYEEALLVWLKSIEIKEELLLAEPTASNQNRLASAYGNIGSLFSNMGRFEKSIKYVEKALILFEKTGNTRGLALSYGNIANGLKEQGDFSEAVEQHKLAIKYARELQSDFDMGMQLFNYGETLVQMKRFKQAELEIKEALRLQKEIEDSEGIALSYLVLSGIEKEYGNQQQALQYGEEALKIALEYKLVEQYDPVYENIIDIYKSYGMIDNAFQAFERKVALSDSLSSIANESQIIELEAKYQSEVKQRAIDRQNEAIEVASIESNRQRIIIGSVSIVLLLIVVFSIIIWNRLRISKIQEVVIQKKNTENELLLGEIHHRVKNNLQVISSLLSLQERNTTDKDTKAAILDGKERVKSMGLIHKMLYQQNNFSGINMSDYIEKLIAGLLDSFGKNPEDFELNYAIININLDVDTAIPLGLIINELVVNSLKHAYSETKEPRINVNLHEIDNQLVLEVEDNGRGVVADVQSSQAFGMKLVKSLTRQLSGTIEIEQQDGLCFKISMADYKLTA